MKNTYSLSADCFVIPYEEKGPQAYIAYFPIQSLVFEINEDAAEILKSIRNKPCKTSDPLIKGFLENLVDLNVINNKSEPKPYLHVKEGPHPTYTLLLLSESCLLKCLYCYHDAKKKGDMMPMQIAKDAIETIIRNAIDQKIKSIHVGYHGGGEPTMNWSVLTESFYYTVERCKTEKIHFHSSICTNGIISKKKALWIIENIRDVSISMDGTPELQNKQRPFQNGEESFDHVASTLDLFNHHKKNYTIRLTATEFSNGKLYSIIKFIIERFHPHIICIEPLFVCGRCETSGCRPPLDDDFIKEMIEVYDLGKKHNSPIQYSGNRISLLVSRFCGAQGSNFFVTPKGDVTACLEISERNSPRADFFIYGSYDPEKREFIFDNDKYQRLAASQVQSLDTCKDCFAKWHCAGDCLAKSPDFSNLSLQRNAYRCKINKRLIRDSLIKTMNQRIEFSNTGS